MNRSLLVALAAALLSCESVNEYTGSLPPLKLVLYSFIEADSLVCLDVWQTRHFSDEFSAPPTNVTGEVYINGQLAGDLRPVTSMTFGSRLRYLADARPRPGDHVRVAVRADGLQEAQGEVTLPLESVPIRVDSTLVGRPDKIEQARYAIHINDKARERHYYRLVVETQTYDLVDDLQYSLASAYAFNPENDPLLIGGNHTWVNEDVVPNRYRIFTNETFEGVGYTMRVSVGARNTYRFEYQSDGHTVTQRQVMRHRVKLIRIDPDSYLHLKSLMLLELEQGVMEPVQVHTNVRGGAGVIGYVLPSVVTFEMPETEMVEVPFGY
ncbi:MAG: DUF4249 domain-containing protein [Odoribacteraceae bacterium]|jgi:hypothetical protein|nr:DUF4249 domain-containing protein [Odoribacteraceae bacterium]